MWKYCTKTIKKLDWLETYNIKKKKKKKSPMLKDLMVFSVRAEHTNLTLLEIPHCIGNIRIHV